MEIGSHTINSAVCEFKWLFIHVYTAHNVCHTIRFRFNYTLITTAERKKNKVKQMAHECHNTQCTRSNRWFRVLEMGTFIISSQRLLPLAKQTFYCCKIYILNKIQKVFSWQTGRYEAPVGRTDGSTLWIFYSHWAR